ncbi:MAG: methyltransferase domain-containing protein [Alphaproteobacteria bacterium]|nr:methyltransferase domain-containing protein [Alphaproteobacteria bacterium]
MTSSGYETTVAHLTDSRIRFGTVIRELARGKSVLRATFNSRIDRLPVTGNVLDLGARNRSSSYYRFLDSHDARVTYCDYLPQDPGMMCVDLEDPLPFGDRSFDVVLLLFVLNHIWNIGGLMRDIRRVCRSHAIIATSFVHQHTPEPHDYSRLTEEGLSRLFAESGFPEFQIFPVGHGPCTLALSALQQTAHFAPGATAFYHLVWAADGLLIRAAPCRTRLRSVMTHISVLRAGHQT